MSITSEIAELIAHKLRIGKDADTLHEIVTGDENTDVPDGKGGFIKTVRKVLAELANLAPQTTAARDAAALSETNALEHENAALAYKNEANEKALLAIENYEFAILEAQKAKTQSDKAAVEANVLVNYNIDYEAVNRLHKQARIYELMSRINYIRTI